jgi:chromosome partitioning protein
VLNLAAALQNSGRTTFAIDLDPQAQFSAIANVTAKSGEETVLSVFENNRPLRELMRLAANAMHVIPSHAELAKVDVLYGKGYNVVNKLNTALQAANFGAHETSVIMDCSPLIGVLSLNAIFACQGLIVPISADHLSSQGAIHIEKTLNALEKVLKRRVNRRYLLTRFDGRRRMSWDVLKLVEEHFGADVCRTRIAENVSLAESPALNKTIFEHAPTSRGAHDYDELLAELLADGFIE